MQTHKFYYDSEVLEECTHPMIKCLLEGYKDDIGRICDFAEQSLHPDVKWRGGLKTVLQQELFSGMDTPMSSLH